MVFTVKPSAATPAASIKDGTYLATASILKQFVNTYGERIGLPTGIYLGIPNFILLKGLLMVLK